MTHYYYTIASLPHLTYAVDRFPSIEEFLIICKENISEKDMAHIDRAKIDRFSHEDEETNEILMKWYTWEYNIRNKLVRARAKKKKIDPDDFLVENPELLEGGDIVQNVMSLQSPLEAEEVLNKARWSYLDGLELTHYFDSEKLIIYYLKLQILHRKALFTKENGAAKFGQIMETMAATEFPRGAKKKKSSDIDEVTHG